MQQTMTPRADQGCVLVSGLDSTLAQRVLEMLRAAGIDSRVREQVRGRLLDPAVGGNLPMRVSRIQILVAAGDERRARAAIEDLFPAQGEASVAEIEAELSTVSPRKTRDEDPSGLGLLASVGLFEEFVILLAVISFLTG